MVIFHSYVSLPEGRMFHDGNQSSPEAGGILHPRLLRHQGHVADIGGHEVSAPLPCGGPAALGRAVPPVPGREM